MQSTTWIATIDTHTMGEPTRIITSGIGPIPGRDMSTKKAWLQEHKDHIRRLLMGEPRGHRDMFGAVITEPTTPQADVGVLFMDTGDYLDMCGHGFIGATTAILETGIIPLETDSDAFEKQFAIDTPAGLIRTRARIHKGRCQRVTIRNQPAFWHSREAVSLGGKQIPVDIAYGGNYFGLVNVNDLGLKIDAGDLQELTSLGLDIRKHLNDRVPLAHPATKEKSKVSLIEFYDEGQHPKNVVIFGAGQVDRSPCGTGTCAKMALLHKNGKLSTGQRYTQRSILETEFYGTIVEETEVDSRPAIIPEITGRAFITGFHQFVVDPEDPFPQGFQI